MKTVTTIFSAIFLATTCLSPSAFAQDAASPAEISTKDFYKQCKGAKSDDPDGLKLCYLDSFVALRKTGDASGKCAPGLMGLLSQPHTHFMRLRATIKSNKPAEEEALTAYQQRILSATYPCA